MISAVFNICWINFSTFRTSHNNSPILSHQKKTKIFDLTNGGIINKNWLGGTSFADGWRDIQKFNAEIGKTGSKYRAYLNTIREASPWVQKVVKDNKLQAVSFKEATKGAMQYGVHLVGATIKTVALQAASMALNAALTWGVSLAIQGIIAGVQALWKLVPTTEHLKKSLEETAQAVRDNNAEIDSLNNELSTTQARINELKAQGTLTFTEASELAQLERENAALKDKIDLLKIANQEKQKDAVTTFNSLVGIRKNADGSEQMNQVETLTFYTQYQGEKYADEHIDSINKQIKALEDLEAAGVTYENADEETKNNIKRIHKLIDVYKVAKGEGANLFSTVYNRAEWSEANKSIQELANSGNLTAESLQNLYNQGGNVKEFIDYMLSLNTVDWKNILGDDFDRIAKSDVDDGIVSTTEALGWMKEKGENSAKVMGLFANELNKVEDAADEAESSFKSIAKTLSDGLDKLSNKKDILSEVKEQLNSFGAISADNISKILEQFPDNDDVQKAVAYYLSGLGTAQQVYDAMAKGYQNDLKLQAQNLATKMQNDEKYYESIGGLNKSFTDWLSSNYNVDLRNCTTLAKTKLEVEQNLIKKLKNDWSGYYGAQADNFESVLRVANSSYLDARKFLNPNSEAYKQAEANWKLAYNAYNQYIQMEEKLNNLTLSSFNSTGLNASLSTKFDTDSGKTEAEKYFEKLKYQLDTNQITQEQYLKDLDWGYKHFYNKTADYLEDYAKYSQEVYDGFKDMYKEDLEAQKDAWEKKKDAVSEYYDKLREEIENTHDEEDYEKEQSEKRKEIFDLDMQIAELMRDGSEKAKARIAELEEERLKAEEELRDFETDKARENELSRLEKEQKAEEDKIQQQIDGIQGQLDKLDKDIISVRNAIIAYAKEKGVTLNFAYASGTRSSVGGFGRINEKGIEMISAPDGNGNYVNLMPGSYVFSAKATEFLWKLATEHSLPQAMYNSIAKSIKTQSSTPSVNIAQPITITMGDIIIKGNADKQTVADIKKQQDNTVRMVLQKIKELQK